MPHHQDPRQWEKEIAAYEKADRRQPPPPHPVLFAGSSSIRFWRLKKFFPDHYHHCLNRGFGGAGLPDLLHYFNRVVTPYDPRAIVFYFGENDIGHGATTDEVIALTHEALDLIGTHLPGAAVLLLPLKPSPMLWERWPDMQVVNDAIAALAAQAPQVDSIDTATPLLGPDGSPASRFYMRDRLHLSQDAYHVWSDLVRPWLDGLPSRDLR